MILGPDIEATNSEFYCDYSEVIGGIPDQFIMITISVPELECRTGAGVGTRPTVVMVTARFPKTHPIK